MTHLNGKKVLNRLILLFVVINIIVLTLNLVAASKRYIISDERINNIITLLETKDVFVEGKMPINFRPRQSINIVYESSTVSMRDDIVRKVFGEDTLDIRRSTIKEGENNFGKTYKFELDSEVLEFNKYNIRYTNSNTNLYYEGINEIKKYGNNLIKKMGIEHMYVNPYVEYQEYEDKKIMKYFSTVKDIPIDDVCMIMEVYKSGCKIELPLARVEEVENSYQEIIPVDRVLFGIDEYINQMVGVFLREIYIREIRLIYRKQNVESDNIWGEKNIPVYKLEIQGLEKPIFVNAYTNDYIT